MAPLRPFPCAHLTAPGIFAGIRSRVAHGERRTGRDRRGGRIMAVYIGDLFMRLGGVSYFSPTFERGGLGASFIFRLFASSATSITITVEHKNMEDTAFAA